MQQGQFEQARIVLKPILEKYPKAAQPLGLMGACLAQLGEMHDAAYYLREAINVQPKNPTNNYMLANVLLTLARHAEAIPFHKQATLLDPQNYWAHINFGISLTKLEQFDQAMIRFDQAIALQPKLPVAWMNRGNAQLEAGLTEASLTSFDEALKRAPDFPAAHYHRALALNALNQVDQAIASYEQAIALHDEYAEAYYNLGELLRAQQKFEAASAVYEKLYTFAPDFQQVKGQLLHTRLAACAWQGLEALYAEIEHDICEGKNTVQPFALQAICQSEKLLQQCAMTYSGNRFPAKIFSNKNASTQVKKKINIGYLCGEFRHQATSLLLIELFEQHDQDQFQLIAFDSGYDDGSDIRRRLVCAFDEFVDISTLTDTEACDEICKRDIDILINLNGFFGFSRQGIFAMKPSRIQVNYLGFPGTIGAQYMDYLIADRFVIPETSQPFYCEKIAYLPNCYQPNDNQRKISERRYARDELGLPAVGFVYCCFNNNYKILPAQFDSWMRILSAVPGSVLWLLKDNETVEINLRNEAKIRGVDPDRLVFADRWHLPEHLARHRQADLFLDSLPYNAHTTASDALWAGLPVLTCKGTTFPGRVAASLLHALGITELVTDTVLAYEMLAIRLGHDAQRMQSIKLRLSNVKNTAPLFDTLSFARNIENLYREMIFSE